MAIIALENIQLYGNHGCYEEEALVGGHYMLDVFVTTSIEKAAKSDDLSATIDYEKIYDICIDVFSVRHDLLEALVYKMAHKISDAFQEAENVRIKLAKLHPPMKGEVGQSSVEYSVSKY